jgi:hypothetical protein
MYWPVLLWRKTFLARVVYKKIVKNIEPLFYFTEQQSIIMVIFFFATKQSFVHNLTNYRPIIFFIISGVGLSPLGTAATSGLLYKPQMVDEGDCGAIGGMKIGRGNRSTRRKPAPAPLCPPQIPHDQTRARTRAAAVGSQWLTAWAMARPNYRPKSQWLNDMASCTKGQYRHILHISHV